MKRGIALLCAVLLLASGVQAVEVSAPSAVLMEKETGTVLFAKDEHKPLEPASVTKVMTLLLTMEAVDSGQLSYDTMITASAHACSMGGSQIWLKENEQLSVGDMLKASAWSPPTTAPWLWRRRWRAARTPSWSG